MRKVYTPPPVGGGRFWPIIGAVLITLAVFLVLPLTQMISNAVKPKPELVEVKVAEKPPPPPDKPPEPPPPPPEQQEQPPAPQLDMPMQNVDLASLSWDAGTGIGVIGNFSPGDIMEDIKKEETVDVSQLDKPPEAVVQISPVYPSDMRRAKVEGTVVIIFVLNEEGRVEDPRVETATRPEFERPAVDAVRKWRFHPGTRGGQPVRTFMKLPIAFSLKS